MSGLAIDSMGNATNCSNPFNAPIYAVAGALAAASGFISLLASCFVIFIIILFQKWRFFTQRLILYLAIAAALRAASNTLLRVDYQNQTSAFYTNFCIFGGFLGQLTTWMVLCSVITINVSLIVTSFRRKPPEKYEALFLLLIFVFPLTFNWIPFIRRAYGRAGPWCWIRSEDYTTCKQFEFGEVLQFVLLYTPAYLILIVLVSAYGVVVIKLYRDRRKWSGKFDPEAEEMRNVTRKEILPLVFYPLIFFVLYIPLLINRIDGLINPDNPKPALWVIAAILFPLEGGAVAVAFSLDPRTRRRLRPASMRAAWQELRGKGKTRVVDYPMEKVVDMEARLRELLLEQRDQDKEKKTAGIEAHIA